jgi:hypothetical protein
LEVLDESIMNAIGSLEVVLVLSFLPVLREDGGVGGWRLKELQLVRVVVGGRGRRQPIACLRAAVVMDDIENWLFDVHAGTKLY